MELKSPYIIYTFSDALRSIKANISTTAFTAFTLAFALSICTLFIIVFGNLNDLIRTWANRTHMVIYLEEGMSDSEAEVLQGRLLAIKGVGSVNYISKSMAFEELKGELKGHEAVLEGVGEGVLPSSFEVTVLEEFVDPVKIAGIVEDVRGLKGVSDLQYGAEWVEKFSAFLKFVKLSSLFVGVFLATATIFNISNTIRLTVYHRKDEIEVMKLMGASQMYIRVPFVLEGALQGFIGSIASLLILALCKYIFTSYVPPYYLFIIEPQVSLAVLGLLLFVSGVIIGVLGSLFSLSKFLRV